MRSFVFANHVQVYVSEWFFLAIPRNLRFMCVCTKIKTNCRANKTDKKNIAANKMRAPCRR